MHTHSDQTAHQLGNLLPNDFATTGQSAGSLSSLTFDNRFVRELPGDPILKNNRREVRGAAYSLVQPTPVAAPKLMAYSHEAAAVLDISKSTCETEAFVKIFSGNSQLPGMTTYATCYGGHQFGNWAGQLGDGRAINLGEIINQRSERWALQLKGSGPTPYSRMGDGWAVVRSSVREFLCSEAMFHLGVPTTRALSLISTGQEVERDMFYDGHPKLEPGAIVCRLAPSFTRFGNFQIFASRNELIVLKQLVDYTIRTDFPQLGEPDRDSYVAWFKEVCRTTADLMVDWMRIGFVHGVMNTDNMSILGLTIDYGPYGWLEDYDPNWTPNTTDATGRRYRFGHQPQIAQWNLAQLANAVYPIIGQADQLQESLAEYADRYQQRWQTMMGQKLGLFHFDQGTDLQLIDELLKILTIVETDMTIFFRRLADLHLHVKKNETENQPDLLETFSDAYYQPSQVTSTYRSRLNRWLQDYYDRVQKESVIHKYPADAQKRRNRMNRVNPKYVLRNYLAQLAIDKAEKGDFSMIDELLELLRHPYDDQPEYDRYAAKRPEWARHRPGCSMLSCSS